MVHEWWVLPGPTPGKSIEGTSWKSKLLGEPSGWRSLWPCRDQAWSQGVKPMGFARAVTALAGPALIHVFNVLAELANLGVTLGDSHCM